MRRRRRFATGGRPHINCQAPSYWNGTQCVNPVSPPNPGYMSEQPNPGPGGPIKGSATYSRMGYNKPMHNRRGGGVRRYNDGGIVHDYGLGVGPDDYDYRPVTDPYVGNVPYIQSQWNQGFGYTPMIQYRRGGAARRFANGGRVCNGPSTGIDEYGNNIC